MEYLTCLARLGHNLYYLEDTGQWPYDPVAVEVARISDFDVAYLADIMSGFGLANKWVYRFPWESQWFGIPDKERTPVIGSADLLINNSCALQRPTDYRQVKRLAYVDTDPVLTQIKLAHGQMDFRKRFDAHEVHFSYGERLSEVGPVTGHQWRPMIKPIVLEESPPSTQCREAFSTVMIWTS